MEKVMTNAEWENFVKGTIVNFLMTNKLQKIVIEDGSGKKGIVKLDSKGQYKIQITSNETM